MPLRLALAASALVAVATVALPFVAAAAAPVERFHCELPSLVGGEPQASVFELEDGVLRRVGGSAYPVLVDDGDTLVAAVTDYAPEVAVVVLVRSTGLLKILGLTDEPVVDPVFFGTCRG